jgi:hypothetical protein
MILPENDTCRIIVVKGKPFLAMPDGTILPKQIFTRVTQSLDDASYAIVKIFVNCDETTGETRRLNTTKDSAN